MKTIKIVVTVVVVLLLVGVVGVIYKFTNGFNEDFKTFYVELDGKEILTSESKTDFVQGGSYKFGIKYTFDNKKSEAKDYTVKVLPNATRDFNFTVDGDAYIYSKLKDMTSAFDIKKETDSFTISFAEDFTLITALGKLYPNKEVVVPDDALVNNKYPFKLVISSYNGEVTYNIAFSVCFDSVTGITLDPAEIIFGA